MDRKHFLLDMDGVLIKGRTPIPGANDFIARLNESDREYVVVTNNPVFTPGDLAHRLPIGRIMSFRRWPTSHCER